MIPYVEIIGKYNLKPFALIEPSECWFELSYWEMGEFQVYAPATPANLQALKMGNYVKIPNKPYLWIIKSVQYTFNASKSRMISAKGYEAKWIVGQRAILDPIELPTNLATAIYNLVNNNLGTGAISSRKINGFKVNQPTFDINISQTQATRGNLWEFVANLLKTSKCGSFSSWINGKIVYNAILGVDRSDYIVFSQSMDNLLSSDYCENSEAKKTFCRVVSTFTEKDDQDENISVDYVSDYDQDPTGIDRHEIVIQSNLSTKYTDENGQEQETTPTSDLYQSWQVEEAKNKLAEQIIRKEFNAEIDLRYSHFVFAEDFFIGDLVKVRDEFFGYEAKARIIKYTFKQDAKGYGEEAEYQSE